MDAIATWTDEDISGSRMSIYGVDFEASVMWALCEQGATILAVERLRMVESGDPTATIRFAWRGQEWMTTPKSSNGEALTNKWFVRRAVEDEGANRADKGANPKWVREMEAWETAAKILKVTEKLKA